MNNNLTDLTLILDRSASMDKIRFAAESGMNRFIEEQKKAPGQCFFSMVQFNDSFEQLFDGVAIGNVGQLRLEPAGNTNLYGAVGATIDRIGERLSKMKEENRPGLVIVAILTDGEHNVNGDYSRERCNAMVKHQQEKYSWQFTYLGANQNAFSVASSLGIPQNAAVNFTNNNVGMAFMAASSNVKRQRAARSAGVPVSNMYTAGEQDDMLGRGQTGQQQMPQQQPHLAESSK